MLLVIVAIMSCVALYAWPGVALRRATDAEVTAALEPPAPDEATSQDPASGRDELVAAAATLGRAVRAAVTSAMGAQERPRSAYGPALDVLVARVRRTHLWAVPLALAVALDVTLLAGPATLAVQALMVTLAVSVSFVLGLVALCMAVAARRKVGDAERDRFVARWGQTLRARAAKAQVRARNLADEARRSMTPSAAPILEAQTSRALDRASERLLASADDATRGLGTRAGAIAAQAEAIARSPHRDAHADAAAQTYAEQAVEALETYLGLAEPGAADAAQVSSVLDVVSQALERESDRLDDKARVSLDVTQRGTEALYRHRYGEDPEAR